MIRPIFILSLPRAGSTLLQRIVGSHEAVATASEPWFLLPIIYSQRESGIYAEYQHDVMAKGVAGFSKAYLPLGIDTYNDSIREFALRIYSEAGGGNEYFLDKTPRYHHIAQDIISLFPDGRFIFLWRNPLAIAASWMETFGQGAWNLDSLSADLFQGISALIEAYGANQHQVISVRYEDVVSQPIEVTRRIFRYLDLPFDPTVVTRFSDLEMRNPKYWDPTGTKRYRQVSTAPLDKWKKSMSNPVRKAWCRRYLRWLGEERLALMGYCLDDLLAEVDGIPVGMRRIVSDIKHNLRGAGQRWMRSQVVGVRYSLWRSL